MNTHRICIGKDKQQVYPLPSLTGRGWGWVFCLLLLFCACSSDDDDNKGTKNFTVTAVAEAPAWAVDWSYNQEKPDWQQPATINYENWNVIVVQIEDALKPYASEDDMLAIFVGDELRGLAYPAIMMGNENAEPTCFLLKAYGNEDDGQTLNITLRYYSSNLKQVFSRNATIKYTMEEVLGLSEDFIPQFTLGSAKYPVVMSLPVTNLPLTTADITPAASDIVAAFVGDECRGVQVVNGANTVLTVFGREAGETATIKYYSGMSRQVTTFNNAVKIN